MLEFDAQWLLTIEEWCTKWLQKKKNERDRKEGKKGGKSNDGRTFPLANSHYDYRILYTCEKDAQ